MKLLFGHDREVAHFVALNIPHLRERIPYFPPGEVFGPGAAIGVLNDGGELIAGVVYHNHDPFIRNIEVSCAAVTPTWGNREIFRALLRYPFDQVKVQRVTALTPRRQSGATSPRRFLEGLGFVREGSIRRGFGTDNAIIYGLLAEEWREGRFCRPRGVGRGEKCAESSAAA